MLAQLYRQWISNGNQVKVTLGELELWREQAEAIERSSTHLATIDGIIQSVKQGMKQENDLLPTCEVDLVVYKTMLRDQTKFHQLAFALIAEHNQKQKQFLFDIDNEWIHYNSSQNQGILMKAKVIANLHHLLVTHLHRAYQN